MCNFIGKELKIVQNYSDIIGVRDKEILSYKNGESKIEDIIDGRILSEGNDGPKNKVIIFNNVSQSKIGIFIENIKKLKIKNVLFAVVTDTSKEWTLNTLINNLVEERKAMQKGTSAH